MKDEALSIAMISDFFYPNVGGVENHIYMLSANLIRRGHKVIVITHSHPPDRVGVRWLLPSLKVYYVPFMTIASSATLPNYFTFLPYFRTIIVREHIQLIHAHASLSSLGQEGILHAHFFGVRTVFTDHSLFGFEDAASILTNKLLAAALKNVDAVICVSHTGRENTVLRGQLFEPSEEDPSLSVVRSSVYTIPNALVAEQFIPSPWPQPLETINIVIISRLAYRKGIDLLVATAPRICAAFPNVNFIVGGDGPKLNDLLQARERHLLQDRIELLGPVRHRDVRDVLIRGSIFLNTSLTEAFGIAILEAACTGLYVVSTRVGGVPEILPQDMISFANPDEDGALPPFPCSTIPFLSPFPLSFLLQRAHRFTHANTGHPHIDVFRALSEAIDIVTRGAHDRLEAHARVTRFYDWAHIAERTEAVYDAVVRSESIDFETRVRRTMSLGPFAGLIYTIILVVDCLFFLFLEWWMPRHDMDFVREHWKPDVFAEFAHKAQSSGEEAPRSRTDT
ncbi:glycosyltransferase family 4 protein [Boletus edulis BED1]|uniref:Glycosyltransferase family 4 protein n=1 Tax=Boletus edulis BED1 TaxID=1328754 RepID=A0AAD4G8T8_BOLED|nr:glycosyltransferase family 4 protein [Boletus edulis BED1]